MADIRVRGAKAGQKEPRKPNISKDTAASISTAKLLYGLAEGEVYDLANGGKSIRLDGTPLVDDAGNPNFEGVTWDFRNGSNDQEYIKGFPDVSNETPINVELRSSQPWIKAFNDTQISAVRVRFKWNRLSETNGENGDVKGYKIDYAIDLQTDGGAYQTVLTTKIQDKTSAGYERTHRIDLPKAKTGWQLRVRRITPNSTSDLIQDTMMIDAIAEVIDVKLAYPNTALLGVQYNAELFSNIAKMSVRVKGKIIRVPDNYDPVARTYTGIWTGNFKDAYSNNPAWIFYDLCTQWRGGLGERLDATMIDRWSLYALGQYCDQPVSDGQGGLEPRFTCNVYLQKQEEAYTVLQNIAGIFRAMSFWTGERIMLDADVPQDPIYTYSSANIVGGVAGIQYSGTRNRDRHTLAKVAWDNPNNDYQTEYEYVRDEKAMSKFGVKVLDLSAFGCTSQAQAQRAGLWALKTEQLETRQVTFSVGLDGAIPRVGNIISLSDEAFAGRANGGRVSTVNSTQRIIELDREVVASVGDVLIINGGSGKSERRNIESVAGRKITVTAGFTSAEPEHIWAIETADLKLMRFRVMSITENDDATYAITAIQHEPQKYDAIDFGTDVKPTEITIVNPDTVDAPASVSIESRHREVQGQTVTTLVIGWSQVSGAVAYDVEWRKDDGTWVKVPRTGNVSVEIEGVYSGNYMARVRAISAFDVQSRPTESMLTAIEGKIGLPPTIVGLTATGILFGMDLKWGFAAGSGDAAYTEIQVGSAPDVNVATLTQVSYPTNTHTINGLQGNLSQSYRARLVDKLGFKSPWSAWVTGTTDANADKIMDLIEGQIRESSLNTALTTKIDKIAVNEAAISAETQARIDAILDANSKINTERDARIADVLDANSKITAEQQARTADVLAANNAISTEQKTRVAEILATNNAINAETQARIDAMLDANNKIDTERDARIEGLLAAEEGITTETTQRKASDEALGKRIDTVITKTDGNTAAIQTEITARTDADTALGQRIDTVTTTSDTNTAAIQTEVAARTNADTALSTRIDTVVSKSNNNEAAISSEVTARTNADSALSGRIDTVSSKTDANTATITTVNNTLTNSLGSQAEQINVMRADYKPQYADASQYADAARSVQWTYWKTVARDNYATNERITVLQSDVASSNATITQSLNTLATKDEALASSIDTVITKTDGNTAAIQTEITARTDADTALSSRIDTVVAQSDGNTAAISSETTARTSADTALSTRIDTVTTESAGNKTAIQTETTARTTADEALGKRIDTVTTSSGENKSAIQTEITARTDADTALGQRIDTVVAKSSDNTAAINSEITARTDADSALSTRIDTVTAESGSNKTAIQTEITARTTADTALGQRIDTVTATSGTNTAAIQTEVTARTNADTALSTRIDTVVSKSNNNEAAISSEVTARTNADSALSGRIDTVSSKTDTNTATITTVNNTLTNQLGSQAEQINVMRADYKPQYADASQYADAARSVQWTYWKTVARDNYATNERITVLQSDVASSNAAVTQSLNTLATKDEALASSIETLNATTGANTAAIQSEATARSNADTALSQRVDTVQSSTATAQTTADQAIADAQSKSAAAEEAAKIYAEAQAKAKADAAQAAASTDATDKAAAAESAAKAAAALDAKNKADAALAAAKLDATAKADAATAVANAAQTAANNAATAAGNKGEVIFGSTTPVAAKQLAQNLWIDTTGGKNTPKRWDGSAWSIVTDKAATDAQAAANAAQATATEALGKANTATTNIATIQTELTATTSKTNATATSVGTLQTTVAGNTASIQTAQSSIDGINLQYTVKLDSGGKISGFGLMNDGATSAFDVRADRFSISAPSNGQNSINSVFMALSSPTEINGVMLPKGIYLNGDMIATGAISGDKIRANTSITAPTINGGQININNNFMVNSLGEVTAKSGTFEGTVLADQISGTIDIATMKRSAWTPGYRLFVIKDLSSPKNTPSDFNSVRQYSSLIPSYGGLSWSTGSNSSASEIGGAMFEIEIDVAQATTVTQKAFVIDNLLRLYINNNYIEQYNDRHPDSSNGGLISYNLIKGVNKIQYVLINNGSECSLSLLGDFINNYNVKFV